MAIKEITSNESIDQLVTGSESVLLLKHSNACPTSFAALEQVEKFHAAQPKSQSIWWWSRPRVR